MLPTKGPELTRIRISSGALPLVSACTAPLPSRPIAQLSPRLYGIYEDDDVGAINLASLAFAMPQRTANDPVDAMKAVIAVEYLVDELNVDPRCIGMSPFPKQEMLEAWPDVRRLLSLAPDAQSQAAINALLRSAWELQAGIPTEAARALSGPPLSLPPQRTLQILSSLPFIRFANIAATDAAEQTEAPGDARRPLGRGIAKVRRGTWAAECRCGVRGGAANLRYTSGTTLLRQELASLPPS